MRLAATLSLLALLLPAAGAQAGKNEGWRAANPEEKRMRKTFLDAQGDWNARKDGVDEHLLCVMTWASWGDNARKQGDQLGLTAYTLIIIYLRADNFGEACAPARQAIDAFVAQWAPDVRGGPEDGEGPRAD